MNSSTNQQQSVPINPDSHSSSSSYYPKIDPNDVVPPVENWTYVPVASPPPAEAPPTFAATTTMPPPDSNPYVSPAPLPKSKKDTVKDVLGKWGKKAAETSKKAEVLAGNMWQHLKTAPSVTDAAVGRIAQGTKVLAEGGYDKVFRQSFETVPEEKLLKYYACYLSTSAGPVMGIIYLSTVKLAFCSDNPLQYKVGEETKWSYYKVVIPVDQLKAVMPSTSTVNKAEKFIQVTSVDNHEFWFMGFVNYDSAVKNLQEAKAVAWYLKRWTELRQAIMWAVEELKRLVQLSWAHTGGFC